DARRAGRSAEVGPAGGQSGKHRARQEILREDRRGAAIGQEKPMAGAIHEAARPEARSAAWSGELEVEHRAGGLLLTLARPEQRNSLSEAMLVALQRAIEGAAGDASVRSIVIAAKGKAFCAGHDLKELTAHRRDTDGGRAYFELLMRQCAKLMRSIVRCPKPVIAAVQGTAQAAGCQLVATCDLAVAAEEATFCTPGVNIRLFCS